MLVSPLLRRAAPCVTRAAARSVAAVPTARSVSTVTTASSSRASQSSRNFIGIAAAAVASVGAVAYAAQSEVAAADDAPINAKEFRPLKLERRVRYNHNTDLFVFGDQNVDMPVASYVVTKFKGADGKDVIRPYTPINLRNQNDKGLFLLVKDYPNGVMSKHMHEMKVGDTLEVKGPLPKYAYKPNSFKQISMIAGGTGLTPMLQLIDEIIWNPEDDTQVNLVFANTSKKDILLKESLDAMSRRNPKLKVTYVIDKPEEGWTGETGYINADLLKKHLPKPSKESFVFVCGPPGMYKAVSGTKTIDYKQGELSGALKEIGYTEENVFKL